MSILFEAVWDFFSEYLVLAPGAFIRWLWGGAKKPFRSYLEDSPTRSGVVGFIFLVVVLVAAGGLARAYYFQGCSVSGGDGGGLDVGCARGKPGP